MAEQNPAAQKAWAKDGRTMTLFGVILGLIILLLYQCSTCPDCPPTQQLAADSTAADSSASDSAGLAAANGDSATGPDQSPGYGMSDDDESQQQQAPAGSKSASAGNQKAQNKTRRKESDAEGEEETVYEVEPERRKDVKVVKLKMLYAKREPGKLQTSCSNGNIRGLDIRATSEQPRSGVHIFKPPKATDKNTKTAWAEGKKGYGKGEKLTFEFEKLEQYNTKTSRWEPIKQVEINAFRFYNGYGLNQVTQKNRARVRQLRYAINGRPHGHIKLLKRPGIQKVNFPAPLLLKREDELSLEIREVYPEESGNLKQTSLSLAVPVINGCNQFVEVD